jgi:large subunit ribosomal protein L5
VTTDNKNTDNNEDTESKSTKKSKSASTPKIASDSSKTKASAKTTGTKANAKSAKSDATSKASAKTTGSKANAKSAKSDATSKADSKTTKNKIVTNEPTAIEKHFHTNVSPALIEEFKYSSKMQVPRIEKIVLNIGLGEALLNSRALENAVRDLSLITGQKPVATKAKKSIATYKLREGQIIGVMVTLRKRRMYEFLERLIISALPRIRDFHGIPSSSFDGRGNYSLGVREQIIFPEIEYGSVDKMRGLQMSIVTSSNTNQESKRLLELLGMPFERQDDPRKIA